MNDLYSQQQKNKRITLYLIAGFIALLTIMGFVIDMYLGTTFKVHSFTVRSVYYDLLFPVVTSVLFLYTVSKGISAFYGGHTRIIKVVDALPVDLNNPDHQRLNNVVSEMAIASGLPMPDVYVIADTAPNAFATGRDPEHSVIGVTEGLISAMDRDELQGVVAHEMSHIRNYDIRLMMVIAVLAGTVVNVADHSLKLRSKSIFGLLIFSTLAIVISKLLTASVSHSREYLADATAAELTRYPMGLASALEKISRTASSMKKTHRSTAHLFISDPVSQNLEEGTLDGLSTHPPIEERIQRLKDMAYADEGTHQYNERIN